MRGVVIANGREVGQSLARVVLAEFDEYVASLGKWPAGMCRQHRRVPARERPSATLGEFGLRQDVIGDPSHFVELSCCRVCIREGGPQHSPLVGVIVVWNERLE